MPATYEKIQSTTLGSAQSTITFSSIPSTYTDLVIIFNGTASGSTTAGLQFNSDTNSNYSHNYLLGDGSTAFSSRGTSTTFMNQFYPNTTIGTVIFNIQNYANTTTNKVVITKFANSTNYTGALVGLWRSTAAINTVLLTGNGTNFGVGSTVTIYGIKAA
jgi:hypothetical protein